MSNTDKPLSEKECDQPLKQATDAAAVLHVDELIRAANREKQLQMQLDDLKQRSAPLWEQEMKQRDSKFICFYHHHHHHHANIYNAPITSKQDIGAVQKYK